MMYIYVFLAMFGADVCWTFYLFSVEERKSFTASVWASCIYLFGAFVVSSYVEDKTLIIAAVIGSFAGTYATIQYKKWKERKKKPDDTSVEDIFKWLAEKDYLSDDYNILLKEFKESQKTKVPKNSTHQIE